MSFRDFTFPQVNAILGLTLAEANLFDKIAPLSLPPEFLAKLHGRVELALALSTEKARSEFIIAHILVELLQMSDNGFGLFSGVEFDVDSSRGLNGVCDFILTRSRIQSVLTAPILAITEAKNDNIRNGLGQCIASMVAAREFNLQTSPDPTVIFGAVTTGSSWKFLKLENAALTLDRSEYLISEPGRIMGILTEMLKPI